MSSLHKSAKFRLAQRTSLAQLILAVCINAILLWANSGENERLAKLRATQVWQWAELVGIMCEGALCPFFAFAHREELAHFSLAEVDEAAVGGSHTYDSQNNL